LGRRVRQSPDETRGRSTCTGENDRSRIAGELRKVPRGNEGKG
jgi:hypothetical protein